MARRDIVVIGASAGGVEALRALVRELPADLPAAIFVVMHMPPYAASQLPEILRRSGPLPADQARDGDLITPGRIWVAPPDRHLLVRRGRIELSRGPRENHVRPAIDPLFRSAARAYGPRVIGVVMSGALYDGTAGLLAIKSRGGIAIVQDPADAAVESMPRSAMRIVAVDHVLPAPAIAAKLSELARQPVRREEAAPMVDEENRIVEVIQDDFRAQAEDDRPEEISLYTCPDCGGVMWQVEADPPLRFRCHVGHAYAPEVLLSLKSEEIEAALWSCMRLLRERATLTRQLATRTEARGGEVAARIAEKAQLDERHAEVVRELLEALPTPADQVVALDESA